MMAKIKPQRIQRKRTKGWRMPPNARYVGRPTVFGNPFNSSLTPAQQAQLYRLFLRRRWKELEERGCNAVTIMALQILWKAMHDRLPELRGKILVCWCPLDQPCHGDPLLELANKRLEKQ